MPYDGGTPSVCLRFQRVGPRFAFTLEVGQPVFMSHPPRVLYLALRWAVRPYRRCRREVAQALRPRAEA